MSAAGWDGDKVPCLCNDCLRVVPMTIGECGAFSHRREQYQPVLVGTFCTGFQYDPRGGHLDAPDFVAAGSMYKDGGRWLPVSSFVIRGAS